MYARLPHACVYMHIHTHIRRNIASRRSEGDFVCQHVNDRSQHPSRFRFASAKVQQLFQ